MKIIFSKIIKKIKYICATIFGRLEFGSVGKNCEFRGNFTIRGGNYIYIGNNVIVGERLRIEAIDKWKYIDNGQYCDIEFNPCIKIGNNVNIEHNVQITSASLLEIGDNTSILANVCITNIIHKYEDINVPPKNQAICVEPTKIFNDVFIGINSTILAGTTLGHHCIVGANSVVKGNFPPYCVIAGIPAKIIKKYNSNIGSWEKINEYKY